MSDPVLGEAALIARLADAADGSSRITVVTPNARLAASLASEFNRYQLSRGLPAWSTPDILPLGAFVERLHEDVLYSERAASGPGVAALLSPVEEHHLWQDIIEASPWGGQLLSGAQAAAQCRSSWQLAHAWRLGGAIPAAADGGGWLSDIQSEDARAFAQWARSYVARTERAGCTDHARLPDLVGQWLTSEPWVNYLSRPDVLVAHAFDMVSAQQLAFFDACRQSGTQMLRSQPEAQSSHVARVPFASAKEELEHAARWARQRLEAWRSKIEEPAQPGTQSGTQSGAQSDAQAGEWPQGLPRVLATATPRIAIVVPDLEARRKEVVRVLARSLDPLWRVPGAAAAEGQAAPLFNLSLGVPLSDWPVVDAALAVLELAGGELEFARLSRLLRSPFIVGADAELGARAKLDAALRERIPPRMRLGGLLAAIRHATDPDSHRAAPACPRMGAALEKLLELARSQLQGARSPQEWARRYAEWLAAVGFPGERVTDSSEFQVLAKWREMLGELARLERVAPRMTHAQALARLRRLCSDTLFQPRLSADGGDAPIQVLGILESGGLSFDHLWVSGLTEQAWPLSARPDPFIPLVLQRKAGIPQATAESALALDQRITEAWCQAATEVVFSHPLAEADVRLLPSPLIARWPEAAADTLRVPAQKSWSLGMLVAGLSAREPFDDSMAPAYPRKAVSGGTRVLTDQAACGFLAFARHRLGADSLATPVAGLDAAARGQLLHALFAHIWNVLKTKAALDAAPEGDLNALIATAAARALSRLRTQYPDIVGDQFAALEARRLEGLARDWLAIERTRADFETIAREDSRTLQAGKLALRGRIDRMDRLADGTHALIDYKSGRTSTAAWLDADGRPDDPQLPLYAVNAGEKIAAVAFARLRKGDLRFDGIGRDKDLLPGVPSVQGHRRAGALFADWDTLLSAWRREIDALADAFAAGDARVDPKIPGKTCERCDLQPLCRVHEQFDSLVFAGGNDAGADAGGEADS